MIESVRDYRVLFVGDTITDEYHYVETLARAAKEPIIPARYLRKEVFHGGVHAAASHAANFCRVDVESIGDATCKVRMVDENCLRKLFEVHYSHGYVDRRAPSGEYDVTVIADFGASVIHAERLKAGFLAVSAQTNSANAGFNLITKYDHADYIVIDEPEARLAAHDRDSPIRDVMVKLAHGRCRTFVVTHGSHGAYGLDDGEFYHQPALTDLVRDTMGAGDAFFAVTAPMAKTGSMKDLLTIGNAAGAIKCGIVGHREPVTKQALIEYLKAHGTA